MKARAALLVAVGAGVFALHAGFLIWRGEQVASQWVDLGTESPWKNYVAHQNYLLSLSYASLAAFTIYAFWRALTKAKQSASGAIGGTIMAAALALGGCWLVGCCGSPLLPIYLGFFGARFVGITKPLILILTLSSVAFGLWRMHRKTGRTNCGCDAERCQTDMSEQSPLEDLHTELAEGMDLPKCHQCGCMKETLEHLREILPTLKGAETGALTGEIETWQGRLKPIKYSCLGCAHCFPAVAMNALHKRFPETEQLAPLGCEFSVRPGTWPPVPGEYAEFCQGERCSVAVSTLASTELADALAKLRPPELCIVGKTETENIGIDKLVKNTITNPTIRFLVVAGREPKGHDSGNTLLSLARNGVDESMRVVGSTGKRPILRNVTRDEVEKFRRQVEVVDMIGCDDAAEVVNRLKSLPRKTPSSCGCDVECDSLPVSEPVKSVPTVQAEPPARIELDKAGYFVILPRPETGAIVVEHYSYDNTLLRTIEGRDARSLYWTILQNGWVSQLSHAAYLGKELTRAEFSLKGHFKFVQDGA